MDKQYPRGKLNESDQGALTISISIKEKTIIIDFGKELSWIGLDKATAIHFSKQLSIYASRIEIP